MFQPQRLVPTSKACSNRKGIFQPQMGVPTTEEGCPDRTTRCSNQKGVFQPQNTYSSREEGVFPTAEGLPEPGKEGSSDRNKILQPRKKRGAPTAKAQDCVNRNGSRHCLLTSGGTALQTASICRQNLQWGGTMPPRNSYENPRCLPRQNNKLYLVHRNGVRRQSVGRRRAAYQN